MPNLRRSYWWLWTILSTGMGRSTVWRVFIDVSEKRFFRIEELSINISCTADAWHQSVMLSRPGVQSGPYLSSVTVPLVHLPLFWYCHNCNVNTAAHQCSPLHCWSSQEQNPLFVLSLKYQSVSASLYIGLCPNLPIQCEEKWWTIEGSKEGRKEGRAKQSRVDQWATWTVKS